MGLEKCGIVYIAIIGEQREPILTRTFGPVEEAELQLSAYAAMDIIQEKMVIQQYSNSDSDSAEPYLGFITPTLVGDEFYKVHAYAAATGFKIIAILSEHDAPLGAIKELFAKIHELFADTVCNPLITMHVTSARFHRELDTIAAGFKKSF